MVRRDEWYEVFERSEHQTHWAMTEMKLKLNADAVTVIIGTG